MTEPAIPISERISDLQKFSAPYRKQLAKRWALVAGRIWGYCRIHRHSLDSERHAGAIAEHFAAGFDFAVERIQAIAEEARRLKEERDEIRTEAAGARRRAKKMQQERDETKKQLERVRRVAYKELPRKLAGQLFEGIKPPPSSKGAKPEKPGPGEVEAAALAETGKESD